MSRAFKRCPICDTANTHKTAFCMNCGASLSDVPIDSDEAPGVRAMVGSYDFRYGETDLIEEGLHGKARAYMTGILLLMLVAVFTVGAFLVRPALRPEPLPTATQAAAVVGESSATERPPLVLATVTQGPPTLTLTPSLTPTPTITMTLTPEPCIQRVQAGEGLYAVVSRCGHRHLDVIPLVVTLNSLNDENDIRAGQSLIIPYPTSTPDPNSESTTEDESASGSEVVEVNAGGLNPTEVRETQQVDPFFHPTATNPPGVQNYTVKLGDTIIGIIAEFSTDINSIDLLNPELTFLQCEMGTTFGGPTCIVNLIEGQVIRVPAPTPTATLSPTPSGSETATPTPTATFNAPRPLSPSARAYFRRDEVVTLRWAATGALGPDEVYRVTVQDLARGQAFETETTDLFFVVPPQWQGTEARQYEYAWSISVARAGESDSATYTTAPQTFTWEGRGEN